MHKPTILFICTGNAGRSQMAEALFRQRYGDVAETLSAGVEPWAALHPMAVRLMSEQGIDMTGRFPKHANRFTDAPLDVVVTIGDRAGAEAGPFHAAGQRVHWDIADPADADGTPDSERVFRQTCQAITARFSELAQLLAGITNGTRTLSPAICTSFDYTIPFDRAMAMVRAAGFDIVSIGARPEHAGYVTPDGRAAMRRILAQNGLTAESVHAPFPEGDRLFALEEDARQESLRQCRLAIDAAEEVDGRIVVLHLLQPYDIPHGDARDRMIDQGRRSIETLTAYAVEHGVQLALENGQRADYDQILADFLTEFDTEHVGFCYDSGHEHVQGTCCALLEQFGHRLLTVHLHDNQGSDIHVLPYEGTLPWDRLRAALRRTPYTGNLLLEVDIKHSHYQDPAVFLAQARERVRYL